MKNRPPTLAPRCSGIPFLRSGGISCEYIFFLSVWNVEIFCTFTQTRPNKVINSESDLCNSTVPAQACPPLGLCRRELRFLTPVIQNFRGTQSIQYDLTYTHRLQGEQLHIYIRFRVLRIFYWYVLIFQYLSSKKM